MVAVIVVLAVVIAGGLLWRVWFGPSASHVEVRVHPHPGAAAERSAAMRAAHQRGPGGRRQDTDD
jgi:hypothetical protein